MTILIALADLMIAVLVLAFVIRVLHKGKKMVPYLQKTFLFVAFIGACIVCSSVTIRVEMRWVYVSLAAALLFLSWMYGSLTEQMAKRGRWVQALPYLSLFTLPVKVFKLLCGHVLLIVNSQDTFDILFICPFNRKTLFLQGFFNPGKVRKNIRFLFIF